jgi:predicted lactoylglutathione lyase
LPPAEITRKRSSVSLRIDAINRTAPESLFGAETRAEVDRLARLVRKIGGKNLDGPELCPGYSPGYYACFFEDPDGNNLEICCRKNPIIAG